MAISPPLSAAAVLVSTEVFNMSESREDGRVPPSDVAGADFGSESLNPQESSTSQPPQDLRSVLVTSVLNLEKLDDDLYRYCLCHCLFFFF